ncbi:hypothetical protein DENIS_1604 [Desulfonema ishimotonii]|uniref:DNA repair protein n=1 Tax=Desulfonema ishimotonii TaxID=45657 RepID=A0A401FUI3_9BACT|nr:CRISPR-associated endonuclease Cas6 [Desulfonema ishimotonii]GBC60647.1 hypothetical protein DENIS_1604 [Desulfonema ishimotonii]
MKIKQLTAIFDFELPRWKIPAFRGAIIEKSGRENILFHNHSGDGFRYAYPLIQYKIIRRNPAVVCLNQGSEEILKFFEKPDWSLVIHGEKTKTEISHISFDYFICEFLPKSLPYRIHNWFALNEKNYRKFDALENETEKIRLLQRILTGNILAFAKGIGWRIDSQIRVSIPRLPDHHLLTFKTHQMSGFTLDFTANISLPEFIGLGKSVSRGFGLITRRKNRWNR